MQCALILLAGGSSQRMGAGIPDKILAPLGGIPVYVRTWKAFVEESWTQVVVVYRDEEQRAKLAEEISHPKLAWTRGGKERKDSVMEALKLMSEKSKFVLIHDCARPWVRPQEVSRIREAVQKHPVVSLAHRVTDTIRECFEDPTENPSWTRTIPRKFLWAMETPQAFSLPLLQSAYHDAPDGVTDDITLLEKEGHSVLIVENQSHNPKITRPEDLQWLPHP